MTTRTIEARPWQLVAAGLLVAVATLTITMLATLAHVSVTSYPPIAGCPL